ncbi:MAG TPA: Holliday junction resolvase RuvX [Acidobacteriota bacterium]|jgi:putative Holliday junction resolvase
MSIVALDIGDKYIGIAVSDPMGIVSRPYKTLVRTSLAQDLQELKRILEERAAELLVVGYPKNMDGSVGPRAHRVEDMISSLQKLGVPVVKVDERLSSREAEDHMVRAGLAQRERNARRDEFAAAVILQRYLEEGSL